MRSGSLRWNALFLSGFLFLVLFLASLISMTFLGGDRERIFETARHRLESHVWFLAEYTERLLDVVNGRFAHLSRDIVAHGGLAGHSGAGTESGTESGTGDRSDGRHGSGAGLWSDERLADEVQQTFAFLPELANMVILDAGGNVRYAMRPGRVPLIVSRNAAGFAAHRDSHELSRFSAFPPEGGQPGQLFLSWRLGKADGEFLGILLAEISPVALYERFRAAHVQRPDAMLLLDRTSRTIGAWRHPEGDAAALFDGVGRVAVAPGGMTQVRGKTGFALVYGMPRYPLRVAAAYELAGLLDEWERRRNWLIGMVMVFSALGLWITYILYRQRQMLSTTRAALSRRDKYYRTLAENFPVGIIMLFDRSGRITIADGQGLEAAGLRKVQMEGRRPTECLPPEVASQLAPHHAAVLEGRRVNFTVSVKDRVYHAHAQPLLNDRGEVEAGMTVLTDVTRREEYETALRKAKEAAEAASELKGQFVANISHELRTPISGIMGITEVALSEGPPEKWHRHFTIIKNVSDGLLGVINDVLDFSRIEAGKMTLERKPFNLHSLLTDCMETLRLRAEQKGLALRMEFDGGLEHWVTGDPGRLRQVLVNLMDNAIKFTESGQVLVEVHRVGSAPGRQAVLFSITDSGVGIPEDRLGDLFNSFSQVDGSLSRQHGGSGLGLAICRHLVHLMGGSLGVESRSGEGSRFYFSVSLEMRAPEELAGLHAALSQGCGTASAVRPLRILLAEDNDLNQEFLTYFLEDHGHTVSVAGNGEEAVRMVRQGGVDIVLMDVQMPVLSGLEATRILRESPESYSAIPIVALTAHAMAGDRERFLQAGMDAFVGKPVDRDRLARALDEAWTVAMARGWRGA
ncbi:ATP-binding protein [Desulfovibrio psychrotolerans]|uniref:histidine kinase n=1 Tax=Desulfovibrio psychrotolerans TaxID=415242 RepID=A0A7J0BY29_9BACT|nr:ATP-binding protein [Desulfovibrio psychrotolerans]GFM38095.1 hypothetical protein DSM19430T_27790 [Desulfovibrio psychrotolerans]